MNDNILLSESWGARLVDGKVEVYDKKGTIIGEPKKLVTNYKEFQESITEQELKAKSLKIVTELANAPKPKQKRKKYSKSQEGYGGLESAYLQWLIMNE